MKKNVSGAFCTAFILITFIFAGCGEKSSIRIAFIGALSGKHSEIAIFIRNAVQMQIDQINRDGGIKGRQISIDMFDNYGEQDKCKTAFQDIFADDYKFIIGPVFSQMSDVAVESIAGRDVLLLSPSMSADSLSGKDDNLLRTASTTSGQAITLAQYALDNQYEKVAIVYDKRNAKYTEPLARTFSSIVEENGITVTLLESIGETSSPDFNSLAESVIGAAPDCLLMCLSAIDGAGLAQQLVKRSAEIDFLGVSWTQTNDLIQHGGRAVEGMVVIALPAFDESNEAYLAFKNDYIASYNIEPSFPAILGYNAASVLLTAMRNAESITPEKVKQSIVNHTFQGIRGPIHIDQYGDVKGTYGLVRVENSSFIPVP